MAEQATQPGVTLDDESWDPFELFDRAMGSDTCRDPYPEFAANRREGPLHQVDLVKVMGEAAKAFGDKLPVVFSANSYAANSEVLRDGKRFSSTAYKDSIGLVMGPTILVMDEPEHGRFRSLVQMAFRSKALQKWEHDLVRPIVNGYIDAFAERGRADLVRELTFPFPVYVIAGLLGLPKQDLPKFHRWAVGLISVAFDFANGLAASKRLGDYFTPIIEARRAQPKDDIISVLTQAELEGTRLDNEHVLGFLRLLLPAGAETTYRSSSNLLFGLLTHPEQLDAVRRDRSLIPRAMEEGLRWETPLTGIGRLCTEDTEVCGVRIPKGAIDRDESHHQAALTAYLVKRRLQKASLTVEDRHEIDGTALVSCQREIVCLSRALLAGRELTQLLSFSSVPRERIVNLLPCREYGALKSDRRLLLLQLTQLHDALAAAAIEQGQVEARAERPDPGAPAQEVAAQI
jgi:cytochrome P450